MIGAGIFINAIFKSRYEEKWFAIMERGAPAGLFRQGLQAC
jgi:hypothetical protein